MWSFRRDTEELIAYQEGRYGSYEYGRYGNPTTRTLEEKIRVLEGAEDCLVSSSGMNSATTMLLALVPAGGHIITTTDCYRRTRQFIQTVNLCAHALDLRTEKQFVIWPEECRAIWGKLAKFLEIFRVKWRGGAATVCVKEEFSASLIGST